jgi:HSP20 family protein
MAIIKWDPFATLPTLKDRINSIFEEAFPVSADDGAPSICDWRPPVDTYEEGETIVITAELPGVKKENVSIDLKDNTIRISGERALEKSDTDKKYFRRERCHGRFYRAFSLPETANPNSISASFRDGLLKIVIHRSEETITRKVDIH